MAPRLICALAALARAYDWTTPGEALTPFVARRSERNIRDLHYSKHDFGSAPLQLRFQVGDVVLARAGINASRRVP